MSHESVFNVPIMKVIDMDSIAPLATTPSPLHAPNSADPEQARAVEAVFVAKEKENQQVAGLLGLWMSTAILHDLAVETFAPPADEFESDQEQDPNKKKR